MQLIQLNNNTHYAYHIRKPLLNLLENDQITLIKNIVINIFIKLSDFFGSFNNQSKEINLKPIAMISCFSLVMLLLFSFCWRQEEGIIPPPTPQKDGII